MRRITVLLCLALLFGSCRKPKTVASQPSPSSFVTTPAAPLKREWGKPRFDVCALLTREEVAEIDGSAVQEANGAGGVDGAFFISQCFYMSAERQPRVEMSVIEKDPNDSTTRRPNDLWAEMFEGAGDKKLKDEDEERAKGKERVPPQEVKDVGDAAYWANGALYVLRKEKILRVAVTSSDTLPNKLRKTTALARKVLPRL